MPAPRNYILEVGNYYTDVFAPTLFDYDGDGEEELLFTMQAYVSEGAAAGTTGRVLTFKHGAVQRYALAPNLHWLHVQDIDKDNRPDLIGVYLNVSIAAHSLADGSFSLVDGAAQEFATRACPPGRDSVFFLLTTQVRLTDMGRRDGTGRARGFGAQVRMRSPVKSIGTAEQARRLGARAGVH